MYTSFLCQRIILQMEWFFLKHVYIVYFAGKGLGFNIRGGKDSPYVPGDPSIFVTRINGEGAAARDGRLGVGDKLLEVEMFSLLVTTLMERKLK